MISVASAITVHSGPLLLILNPAAGRGAGGRFLPKIKSLADEMGFEVEVYCTSGRGDARDRAAKAVAEGWSMVAAAGGDGTISEVAGALMDSPLTLAILPVGTGNDLARHLSLPLNPLDALRSLGSCTTVLLDAGIANGIPFFVAAGAGFDAAVAEDVNRGVWGLKGSLAYAVALVRTLWRYQCTTMCIGVNSETMEMRAYFAVVANARGYGGGMKIAPAASIRDGQLDVCCVKALSRLRFLAAAGKVYSGKHVTHPAVRMLRGASILINSDPPVPIVVDGEICGQTPLAVSIKAGSLRLAFPLNLPLPA